MRTLPAGLAVFFLAHGALASAAVTPGYKLSLTVAGNGSVADSKGRITCTTNCARSFKEGVKVALNATPAAGLKFTSWGGACLGTGTCRLTMDGNLSVSARFAAAGGTTPPPPPPPQPPPPPPPPPPGSGTPYPGHTYQLPTTRPFISLAQYAGGSSAAVTRLRGQVDSAVAVTKSIGASGSYSALVNALNSNNYGYSSVDSVIMYKLTGNVAYIDQAIRMVDLFVTSENALINAGSVPKVAGDSYLEVGDYISQLALAYDYGFARLTTAQRSAWSSFAEQTIYNVWNYENATWGAARRPWTGWSVNDPGNNYYYSFLKATQLWALASQNKAWISFLQTQKYPQLVPFFSLLKGGGSREGTGYGTAFGSLFENYAYWKDSTGEDLSAYSTHARDTIDYWIHATVPTFEYFAPIGDQSRSSMPIMFDYQRKIVIEATALNAGSAQGQRGAWWLARAKVTDGGSGWVVGSMRYNYDFKYDLLNTGSTQLAPTALYYDSPGTGALFARSDWSSSASWMHLNAGYYDQSHAHQDQGSFSFFKNKWLTVSSNVYSNSGINQETNVENVLRFDYASKPVPQNNSVSTKQVTNSGDMLQVNADLSPAYSRNASRVSSWTRQFNYQRSTHTLSVHDRCSVGTGVTPVWQLHVPVSPTRQSDGSYVASGLRITPRVPAAGTVKIVSMKSVSSDFTGGYRFELTGSGSSCEFVVDLTAQ